MLKKIAPASPYPASHRFGATCLLLGVLSGALAAYLQSTGPSLHFIGHSLSAWIGVAVLAASRGKLSQSILTTTGTLAIAVVAYYAVSYWRNPIQFGIFPIDFIVAWVTIAIFGGISFSIVALNLVQGGRRGSVAMGVYIGLFYGDAIESFGRTLDASWLVFTSFNVVNIIGIASVVAMLVVLAASGRLSAIRPGWLVLGVPFGTLGALAPPLVLSML